MLKTLLIILAGFAVSGCANVALQSPLTIQSPIRTVNPAPAEPQLLPGQPTPPTGVYPFTPPSLHNPTYY